ncbi:T9SS type A sorting domain-containing protein [Desulfosarcina sp.]|nr:T9SS type A sorting domain-containing protein [Desulfosarcina sp.]
MKISILTILSFTSLIVFGQNWSPIQTNEKINYQHSDSAFISHTIWIDHFDATGSDTTFFLNKVAKDHPTDIDKALRNQPQFLYTAMIRLENGVYHFADPGFYILKTQATTGASWVFDLDNNTLATVSEEIQEEVFGVLDSVKIISISDGSEIKLSKSFGILKFPDIGNNGFYELVGIQGTEYGLSVPGFWEIYDFEVGDVFQYNHQVQYIYDWANITRKVTITSKSITDSSINYSIEGIYYGYSNSGPPASYTFNDEYIFTDSVNHPANKFPGQIYILPYSEMPNSDTVFTVAKVVLNAETGLVHKHFGNQEENYVSYETDLFQQQNEYNDTLFRLEYASLVGDPCGLMGTGFGETIGDLYKTEGCFEYWSIKSLMGYIKDGDTVGSITPDSLLLTSIKNNESKNLRISVFPNPATEVLNISFHQDNENSNSIFELRNLQGFTVLQKELSRLEESINVANLKTGVYFYTIYQKRAILQKGKILIN